MLKNIGWVIAIIVAAILQTTWPDGLKLQGVAPDLTLLLVVYFAFNDGEERAMFSGLLGGLYLDVVGDFGLGHHVLSLVVVGYIAGKVSTRFITEHPAVKVGSVFVSAVIQGILFTLVQEIRTPDQGFFLTLLEVVVPGAFYSSIFTPVIFGFLQRMFHPYAQNMKRGYL
jgi:rod shape-determining protein MreD